MHLKTARHVSSGQMQPQRASAGDTAVEVAVVVVVVVVVVDVVVVVE